jgi:hypothetical protein
MSQQTLMALLTHYPRLSRFTEHPNSMTEEKRPVSSCRVRLNNISPSRIVRYFGVAESKYDFFREAAWIRRFSKKIIP